MVAGDEEGLKMEDIFRGSGGSVRLYFDAVGYGLNLFSDFYV